MLKKEFLCETSYGIPLIFNIISVAAASFSYFFIDKLFGYRITGHLEEFGVNYFAYVLLGMALFSYIGAGIGSFSERIRIEQMQGTLEALLLTPARITTILSALALWNLIFATLDLAIYLGLGIFIFHINFSHINIFSTVIILLLAILSFSGLGILSAGFLMIFKRGNPFGWLANTAEGLLGGIYFPVTVLPGWLQTLSRFFPIMYAVKGLQLAVYRGYSVMQLKQEIGFLCLFSCILLPVSLRVFAFALKKSRRDGSLTHY